MKLILLMVVTGLLSGCGDDGGTTTREETPQTLEDVKSRYSRCSLTAQSDSYDICYKVDIGGESATMCRPFMSKDSVMYGSSVYAQWARWRLRQDAVADSIDRITILWAIFKGDSVATIYSIEKPARDAVPCVYINEHGDSSVITRAGIPISIETTTETSLQSSYAYTEEESERIRDALGM